MKYINISYILYRWSLTQTSIGRGGTLQVFHPAFQFASPAEASGFRSFAKAKKTEVPDSSEDESDSSGKGKTTDPVGPQQDDLAVRLCKPMKPIIYG